MPGGIVVGLNSSRMGKKLGVTPKVETKSRRCISPRTTKIPPKVPVNMRKFTKISSRGEISQTYLD